LEPWAEVYPEPWAEVYPSPPGSGFQGNKAQNPAGFAPKSLISDVSVLSGTYNTKQLVTCCAFTV
jgi:hypothetical protein